MRRDDLIKRTNRNITLSVSYIVKKDTHDSDSTVTCESVSPLPFVCLVGVTDTVL